MIRSKFANEKSQQEEKQKEEDRLLNIGLRPSTNLPNEHFCSVDINIERIKASINSGFKRLPNNLSEEEIIAFIWNK